MRSVESLEGLAVLGTAEVGPLRSRLPALLWSAGPESSASNPAEEFRLSAGAGVDPRELRIEQGGAQLRLRVPILSPELSGTEGAVHELAPRAFQVHWPVQEGALATLRRAGPELLVLSNARQLLSQGEPFVEALVALRRHVGARPVLWAPRVGLPNRLAMLAYLGVDWIDDTESLWRAAQGTFLHAQFGTLGPDLGRAFAPGGCPSCTSRTSHSLEVHAVETTRAEWALVTTALAAHRLRELVESRTTSEPLLEEMLRHADRIAADLLEERTPVVDTDTRGYVLASAFRRPEVRRFRARFLARYRPPPSKRLLLVVPCSKTKPYRNSRSHRRFRQALESVERAEQVHIVSITSPLGLVPRELEDVYPAKHYDIPVTGEWDEGERAACVAALQHLHATGTYAHVLFHLDPNEYGFLHSAGLKPSDFTWTCPDGRPTSTDSLDRLRRELQSLTRSFEPVPGGPLAVVREELRALASFQFGPEAAERLFAPPVRLAGRPWFQRLTGPGGEDLATWREERGLFQLTVAGGRRLVGLRSVQLEVDPEVELVGDLFGPGVALAAPEIRKGDAVVLVRGSQMVAVGEALLPGTLLGERLRGKAVDVRHRVPLESNPTTDSEMDPQTPASPGPVV